MQFLHFAVAVLSLLSFESAFAVSQTVTRCTATKTSTVTRTTSKTITKALITKTKTTSRTITHTTSVVKTQVQTVSVSLTVTKPVTQTVTKPVTQTVTSTLKSTVLQTTTTTVLRTTTSTVVQTTTTTVSTAEATCIGKHVNVIPNGGFEHQLDGWIVQRFGGDGGTLSARCDGDPGWVSCGSCAAAAVFPAASFPTIAIHRTITECTSTHFDLGFQVRITGGCSIIVWLDGDILTIQGSTGSPAKWLNVSVGKTTGVFQSPDRHIPWQSDFRVEFHGGSEGNCEISMDNIVFEETPVI